MLIYQIHRETGEYEDYSNDIIGSYLREERAKEELKKLEEEALEIRKQKERCRACSPYEDEYKCADYVKSKYWDHCINTKAYNDIPNYYVDVVEAEE